MKTRISIPIPCHEDWGRMTKAEQGRYCASCEKVVVDFTGKTDQEITDILKERSGQKLCGRFLKTQVDHSPGFPPKTPVPHYLRVFAACILLVFGSTLISCHDFDNRKVKVENAKQFQEYILGGVMPADFVPSPSPAGDLAPPDPDACDRLIGEVALPDDVLTQQTVLMVEDSSIVKADSVADVMPGNDILDYNEMVVVGGLMWTMEEVETIEEPEDSAFSEQTLFSENQDAPFIPTSEELTVYPNPSAGSFNISYTVKSKTQVILQVLDGEGKLVRELVNISDQHTGRYIIPADVSGLAKGLYLVKLSLGDATEFKKVIIQ